MLRYLYAKATVDFSLQYLRLFLTRHLPAFLLLLLGASQPAFATAPTINYLLTPATLTVGQPYTIKWSSSGGAAYVGLSCTNGGIIEPELPITGQMGDTALASWVSSPPNCAISATNSLGQTSSKYFVMTTAAAPKVASQTSLGVSNASPAGGASVTFTATVSGKSPTGNVAFADDGAVFANVALSNGVASYVSTARRVGSHTITATYAGDTGNLGSTSSGVVVTWAKFLTTTALTVSSSSPPFGAAVTFTATVSGGTPTGNIVFADGGTTLATVPLSGNAASYASPALSVGSHTITASYVGDSVHAASASAGVGVTWAKSSTSTALAASSNSPAFGAAVSFTATVSGSNPTGSIVFADGGTTLATVPLSGGSASYASPALSVGGHTITASYSGDGNNTASGSSGVGVTWQKQSTTTGLAASSSSPAFGAAVTFTATVSGSSPTGNIVFADGATTLATVSLSGGVASYTSPPLSVGGHTITASYSGDGNNTASASAGVGVTWPKQSTTTGLSATPTSPAFGAAVTLTATVSGSSPTGNIVFADGATTLATVPLSGGAASYVSPALTVGGHTITASYAGDGNNSASASAGVGVTWSKQSTTTGLTASATSPAFGTAVTFTATVSGSSPTGSIVFADGATTLATVALSGGAASYAGPALSVGAHTITASYAGDGNNTASASAGVGVTWAKRSTTTALSASSTAPAFGSAVTFTATVTGSSPTGNIVFADGATTLATVPLSGGAASYASPALSVGAHTITASYAGDGNNTASVSGGVGVTWSKTATTTNLSASSTSLQIGTAVTFTATVTGSSPTGNIVFADGATTLANVPVSGGAASYASPALSVGSHTITARYAGDGNNTASVSAGVGVTWAKLATTTALNVSSAWPLIGTPVTFSATVAGGSPTGNVVFADGATTLATVPLSGGVASYASPALAQGLHNITASYEGNATSLSSVSPVVFVTWSTGTSSSAAPLPVNIVPPDLDGENAGTLPGALGVSDSGAATYSIPIVVPPGTAGMQPNLSLNYSSQAQNGMFGLGWSISGMPSIGRCGKTIAQDGINERINFSTSDRLCLDGQRLVLVNATPSDANYWSATAEYRTEIESFSRIKTKFVTVNGSSVRSFEVWSKDGRISTFGSTPDSYVKAITTPIASGDGGAQPGAKDGPQSWALDSAKDRSGNFIKVAYEQDATTGEHRPTFIRYGGSGLTSHAAVQFSYADRNDKWKRYIDETRHDLRSRVDQIKTYVGTNLDGDVLGSGTVVRAYALQYEYSGTSGRSLLNSVQVSARNPNTNVMESLRPTKFDWGKRDPNKKPGFESKGIWPGAPILTVNNYTAEFGNQAENRAEYFAFNDFNADGLADVLEKRVATEAFEKLDEEPAEVRKREASNFFKPGTQQDTYRYFHNTGSGFTQYTYSLWPKVPFVVLGVGDFNGDGKLDLFAKTTEGTKICLSPLGGSGNPGAPGSNMVFNCKPRLAIDDWYNTAAGRAYVFDPLGDGRSAAYSTIRSNGAGGAPVATFCNLSGCKLDNSPPPTLAFTARTTTTQDWIDQMPELTYTSLDQSVDFAGIGKPYDVRFSEEKYVPQYYDGVPDINKKWLWVNTNPTITVTSLGGPDSTSKLGGFASYRFPTIPNLPPQTTGNQGTRGYVFDYAQDTPSLSADFNGSGYSSLAFGLLQMARNADGSLYLKKAETNICLSTGRALDCSVRQKYSGDEYRQIYAVDDFVGDGLAAMMVRPMEAQPYPSRKQPGTAVEMCRVTGEDSTNGNGTNDSNMNCTHWPGLSTPWVNSPDLPSDRVYSMDLLGTGRMQMVVYRSGRYVNNAWVPGAGWEVIAPIDVAVAGQALDRIYQVTNGLGATATVEYVDGLTSGIVRQTGNHPLTYPLRSVRSAGKIVSKLSIGTGGGNMHTLLYSYEDAANDASGRGSPGFAVVQSTDQQSGIVTRSEKRQDWPYVGMPKTATVTDRNGVVLSQTSNTYGSDLLIQANGMTTICPELRQSATTRRDLSDPQNANFVGFALSTSTTISSYTDGWCNANVQSTTTVGGDLSFNATTTTDFVNDASNWLIGLPKTSVVSRTDSSVAAASLPRTVKNEYDSNGLLYTQTVEPDDVKYKVVTTYIRSGNPFGLVNSKTVAWFDPATNAAIQRDEQTMYDANGRFPATVTNPLGQSETQAFDAGTGARTSLTGPNGLQTLWTFDGFGQVTVEKRADGNETRFYQKFCSACPSYAVVATIMDSFHGADRTSVPEVSYSDNAGHVVRSMTWGFDGRVIIADLRYDALGRLYEADHPRFDSDGAVVKSRHFYDDLNRAIRVETYGTGNTLLQTSTQYQGLTRTLINELNQVRVETRDALGQLRNVVQKRNTAGEVKTTFAYDVFGGLVQTIDPNRNVIAVTYDKLGRRTVLQDPDLGNVTYEVDPVGQVWRQISPKQMTAGQSTTFRFDLLGRMTARYESDLESHWVYDQQPGAACAMSHSCGQLIEAYTQTGASKDYDRLHTYDELGRPRMATQVIGDRTANVMFRATNEYDSWNRLVRQTYQRNADSAKVFDTRYNNTGYLSRLERGSLVLWQMREQDAANRPRQVMFGNGLTQKDFYDANTDRLASATLVAGTDTLRLQEGYDYDPIGNVNARTQFWDQGGFTEIFKYDELNRIKLSKVGTQEQYYSYDDAGNIKSWTGGGAGNGGSNYEYSAHAVQRIDGGPEFKYDANGNMTSGRERSYTWNSFDMPVTMSKVIGNATISSAFVYGPDHQRTRQTRSDGSVEVYGGAQITESKAGVLTVKTYWPLGVGMEIDVAGAPTTLNWVHSDRLGSPVGISNQAGELKEKLAYDVWGKRRSTDGSILTPDTLDGVVDNKGFTGHEMLDQLDLVHMNGRVYDPAIGRFLSADPILQDPTNGQSYNRYSYVLNNPTNLTDPTGFEATQDQDCGGKDQTKCAGKMTQADRDCAKTKGAVCGVENGNVAIGDGDGGLKIFDISTEKGRAGLTSAGFEIVRAKFSTSNGTKSGGLLTEALGTLKELYNEASETGHMMNPAMASIQDTINAAAGIPREFTINPNQKTGAKVGMALGIILTRGESAEAAVISSAGKAGARNYSVFFEVTLEKLGVGTRPSHFMDANKQLASAMAHDPGLAKMAESLGIKIPENLRLSPEKWTWHHVPDKPGVMQLVERSQHQGSWWQKVFHYGPNNSGGFKIWGADY